MSRFYSLNKLNTQNHRLDSRKSIKIKKGYFIYLIIFLIIFSSLAYIMQVNSIVAKGFKIEELEKKVSQLRTENKKLEIIVTQLQSIGQMKEVVSRLGLVKTSQVEYLKTGEEAVVIR